MHPEVPQQIHEARARIAALESALLDTEYALECANTANQSLRESVAHVTAQRDTARDERDSYHVKLATLRLTVRNAVEA